MLSALDFIQKIPIILFTAVKEILNEKIALLKFNQSCFLLSSSIKPSMKTLDLKIRQQTFLNSQKKSNFLINSSLFSLFSENLIFDEKFSSSQMQE
jgi:hypothetical protein